MEELADKWQDLSDIQQASVTELIAGKRQGNIVSSLMNNFDIAQKALETSLNSSGSAMAEHAKWQQSLEAQILKLKAAWQSLSQSFMSSNFLKGAMDAVIGLVDAINWLIDTFGTLPTLIGAFAAFESFQGVGFFSTMKDEATGAATGITSAFNKIKVAIDNVKNDSTISFDTGFTQSLADDETALLRYRLALNSGMTAQEAFNATMQNASPAAQQYARTVQITGESVQKFADQQKMSELSMKAQDKSWGNCSKLINSYNKSMQTCGLTQEQFLQSIQASNPALHKYLSGLNGANATFGGYIKSLVGATIKTFALEAATMALNAALTMGISAAISLLIKGLDEAIETSSELAERIGDLTSEFKEQHNELMKLKGSYDVTNEDSMVSKYAKLSKGVDNLGRNVSLTADEYSEYQSIVGTIADQIPSLVSGYDSQGNAILSCAGNVEKLTEAYENLIHAQNQEILTNSGSIEKDFANTIKDSSGEGTWSNNHGFWSGLLSLGGTVRGMVGLFSQNYDLRTDTVKRLERAIGANKSEREKIYEEIEADVYSREELRTALERANVDIGYLDSPTDVLEKTLETDPAKVKGIIDNYYAQFADAVEEQKTIAEAVLSEAFDIRTSDYYGMSDTLKSVAQQMVNSFDYDFFAGLQEKDISVEDYVGNMLEQLDSIDDKSNKKIEAAFDLKTQFNGGEINYGDYVKGLEDVGNLIDTLDIDNELKTQLKLSVGLNEKGLEKEYRTLMSRMLSTEYDFDPHIQPTAAAEFLNSLSAEELSVAVDVITRLSDNGADETIQDIRAAINREMAVQGLTFDLNFEIESASIDAFNTALTETVTASGLSSDSISALKGRYAELESQGYDLSSMFEETSNGIHLNRKAVGELERAYAKQKQTDITEDLQSLQKEYDLLTNDINNCNDASERASLYVQRDAIAQQINDAATLAAQYQGLTSAYNDWLAAEEAGQERDMYENIIEGFENIDDEISRGWMDDGTIEFLELLTGKDLSTSSIDDLKAAYKGLKEEIGDSGYSIRDFFTVNEDGDSTNTGVYNFLETIESFDKLKGAIQRDKETGEIEAFNFSVVGGDQAIAEALGISEELVQIMVRAADDAGFVITLDGTYTQLADLKAEAESANDSLKKLYTTTNGKLGTDYTFNFSASSAEDATTELDKAVEVLNQYKKNGVIDLEMEGADEALKVAETLQIVKNKLEEPVYMSINASELQEELQEPVELFQEYEKLTQERDLLNLSGEDTERLNEIDTELTNIATELNNLPEDTKVKLGIDDLNVDQIKEELENGTIEIQTELTIEANMDKSLEDLVTLGLLEQGLITEKEARIRLGLEVDEVDTSAIEEALDGAELNKDQEVDILAVAEVLGVEDVETLSEKLNGLDDKTIEAIAKVLGQIDVEKLKKVMDGLDDKTVEAIAKAIGEGNVSSLVKTISGLDDKTVQAIAEAFGFEDVEGLKGAVKNLDGKTVKAVAEVLGITDVDSLRKAISRLDGKTVEAVANVFGENKVSSLKSAIDSLKDKTINVVTNFIENGSKKGESAAEKRTGKNLKVNNTTNLSEINGTAHADGTVGRAFKQGSWGTKSSGTALVGELGREVLVRDGRYYTIGDNGAEFIKYRKGDIIFNHVQSEELFKNGKVTSGGGRAKAFATGTAFSSGFGGVGKATMVYIEDGAKDIIVEKKKTTGSSGDDGAMDKNESSSSKSSSGGSGGGSSSKEKDDFEETIDWIETKIDRIERAIDKLDKKASSVYKNWSIRNEALVGQIEKVEDEIDLQQQAYDRYIQQANSVGLDSEYAEKVRSGKIDIETITDESLKEKIDKYTEWHDKALECQDAIDELKETEASLYQQRFENVSSQYEGILGTIEHEKNMLDEYINQSETQGWLVSYEYYRALSSNEKRNIAELEKQKSDMLAELQTAMESGTIERGSESWYEMVSAIDEVSLSLAEANTRVMEISQTAQQLKWEQFDLLQDKISVITEETEFLIELMSNDKLFDDNGQLTDSGMATMGQHGVAYNVLMQQANQAREEAERLQREKARALYNGTDTYDEDLEERYRELIALQQEYILAAEDQKEAIRNLVEEGIQLELDALQERIDKYNEALDSQKDLYDYQKKVKEQTKEIASLEKQMYAYSGDTSEESQQKIQQLKVDLESAREELKETEYDKYISDQQEMLDELYLEYEEILNTRLDNIDALISDMIAEINANASVIGDTISDKADSVGYVLSDSMETIWDTNSSKINSVITTYGEKFSSAQTTTNNALNTINVNLQNMIAQLNTIAKTNVTSASTSSASGSKEANASAIVKEKEQNADNKNTSSETSYPYGKASGVNGNIGEGASGIQVKAIQYALNQLGYGNSGTKDVDGIFGSGTKNAVKSFQKAMGISSDGIVGDDTKAKFKAKNYSSGKFNFLDDEIAWTQDGGKEFIIRPSDGAILTPIARGDSVLTSAASKNIWNMANSPAEFIKDNLGIGAANVPNNSTVQSNYTQHLDKVVFSFPNVHSYDEMLMQMKKDKNFERLINSMTIDQIAGKSSLAKGKSIR